VAFNATIARRSQKICPLLGGIMLLAGLYGLMGHEVRASAQNLVDRQPACSQLLVIQGRITGIQGIIVTVKVPNGYPGKKGGHAQFVIAGPILRVDVSHARVLLPDGKQTDTLPLAIGDRVLMVLAGSDAGSAESESVRPTYSALTVERVVSDDKITTH
jgi:hypothetical protein